MDFEHYPHVSARIRIWRNREFGVIANLTEIRREMKETSTMRI